MSEMVFCRGCGKEIHKDATAHIVEHLKEQQVQKAE